MFIYMYLINDLSNHNTFLENFSGNLCIADRDDFDIGGFLSFSAIQIHRNYAAEASTLVKILAPTAGEGMQGTRETAG